MSVNWDSFSPPETHETDAIRDLGPHTLQSKQLFMRRSVAFATTLQKFPSRASFDA